MVRKLNKAVNDKKKIKFDKSKIPSTKVLYLPINEMKLEMLVKKLMLIIDVKESSIKSKSEIAKLPIAATSWFSVSEEIKVPIAIRQAPNKMVPTSALIKPVQLSAT